MCRRITYNRASCPKCGDLRKSPKEEVCSTAASKGGFGKCGKKTTESTANIVHNCPNAKKK
jgi:hypothetical protein